MQQGTNRIDISVNMRKLLLTFMISALVWKGHYCWREMGKPPSPSPSSAIIYYLSSTAHIFNYLPLAAVVNELFTLCWIMYHSVHKQRSLHTVPRRGRAEVPRCSGGMTHYGRLWTLWATSWELVQRKWGSSNDHNMRPASYSQVLKHEK